MVKLINLFYCVILTKYNIFEINKYFKLKKIKFNIINKQK